MAKSDQAPTTSWFYRVGNRDVGPVMSSRLKQLARQGRLSDDDLVRMGRTGEWVTAGSVEWLSTKPRPQQKAAPEPEEPVPVRAGASAAAEMRVSLGYKLRNIYYSITHLTVASLWVVRHALGVAALIGIMVLLYHMAVEAGLIEWSGPVDVLGTVQTLGAEVKSKRDAKASEAEWDELTTRGTSALQPVVAKLQREAGSHNRIAQFLLWSARDCLPKMFKDSRTDPSPAELRYDEYMANVDALEKNQPIYGGNLGGRIDRQTGTFQSIPAIGRAIGQTSWTTIALVVLMVGADVAIVVWLVRAWRGRGA